MKKLNEVFTWIYKFYINHHVRNYFVVTVVVFFLILLTLVHKEYGPFDFPFSRMVINLFFTVCILTIAFIFFEFAFIGLMSFDGHGAIVDYLNENTALNQLYVQKVKLLRVLNKKGFSEYNLNYQLNEIMQVVYGETWYQKGSEVLLLFWKVSMLILLYSLIAFNYSLYKQQFFFNGVGPKTGLLTYIYNMTIALFIGSYDINYPIAFVGRIFSIIVIASGLFVLFVVFYKVITNPYYNPEIIRSAYRTRLIIDGH